MAILNPEHLLEQAERLIARPRAGPPRQVDIRRAISSAYYAVLHATLTAAADEFVGVSLRSDRRYGLVHRSVDHRALADLCAEAVRHHTSPRFARYSPDAGFGAGLQAFAAVALDLQEKRIAADYDPMIRVRTADARVAIDTARVALRTLAAAPDDRRRSFLALLLFRSR
ncbi:MAG TPA: hypothetical protein VE443_07375 [Beijerinckiaceae bacterium]|nr:uncharacterized protein [Microvirga sp.]HZB37805.1 hypothetical protein [Beijerinckiaceae bacterium]